MPVALFRLGQVGHRFSVCCIHFLIYIWNKYVITQTEAKQESKLAKSRIKLVALEKLGE